MFKTTTSSRNFRTSLIAVAAGAMLYTGGCAMADGKPMAFDIPADSTATALNDLAVQANVHLLFPFDVATTTQSPAIKGNYTVDQALDLILAGSGLEIASQTDDTITLRPVSNLGKSTAHGDAATEVIVTGSHIRGGNPTSPVHTVTRADIDASGYAQVGDVMRALPENFAGGQNPGVIAAGGTNIANQNITNASTVNLRGLGSDATLVLLNGHRLAADSFYQGSDIAGIPLAAVQRIEVVPDGASALYGSDAVAGVVNIILRKGFSGGELSARVGATREGGGGQKAISLLQGWSGPSGYLLFNAELDNQDPIMAGDRAFASGVPADGNLMLGQKRHSLFVAGGHDIGDQSTLSFDATVSDRSADSRYHYSTDTALSIGTVYTPNYSVAATFETHLSGNWKLRATGVAAGSRNSQRFTYPDYNYSGVAHYANATQYGEVTADGTALTLPSGDLKVAVGGGYRNEHYASGEGQDISRNITYLYVEALAPLVAPSDTRLGLEELELSLSARTEKYSDFGSTTNPRVGLRYKPAGDLTLRATWGTSFKAPSFIQMYDPYTAYLYPAVWFGYSGSGAGIMTWGGNADLKPETSRSTTFGVDYQPEAIRSLKLSATWFDIDYTNRVVQPIGNYLLGLSDPSYAPFVELSPSAEVQAALIASVSNLYNATGADYDPTTVVAILHNQYTNATAQRVKGLDLSYRQTLTMRAGQTLSLFVNGSWLQLRQQSFASAPAVTLSGTIFNAPKFKARGGATWVSGPISASAVVNYIAPETDNGVTPSAAVASWTTVDANVVYNLKGNGGREGWKIAVIASNLFDKSPPYTVSPATYPGLHFDSTNASLVGRFLSMSVARSW
jgi:outer membrane receptor protein involved in Fe transport